MQMNPLMPNELFYPSLWTGPFPIKGVSGLFLELLLILKIPVLNANSLDPDQTLRPAASDIDLHYLPMPLLGDDRHKWVKVKRNRGRLL